MSNTTADIVGEDPRIAHLERTKQDTERELSRVADELAHVRAVGAQALEDATAALVAAESRITVEANRAAEMEAQANREQARADAAEQMVAELRTLVGRMEAKANAGWLDDDHACVECVGTASPRWVERWTCARHSIDAALSRTEAVAGRWCPVPQRPLLDGLRRCTACGVLWSVWGPSTVQPHGSMSTYGRSCASCESSGPESAVFQRVEVFELVAERDAAIAARDEAVAKLTACEIAHVVEIGKVAAAERARDEVGIQLAAAQAEIARLKTVVDAFDRFGRNATDENMIALGRARRALDTVPGDALAPVGSEPLAEVDVFRGDDGVVVVEVGCGEPVRITLPDGTHLHGPMRVAPTFLDRVKAETLAAISEPMPVPTSPAGVSAPASGSTPAASSATSSDLGVEGSRSGPSGTPFDEHLEALGVDTSNVKGAE